VRERRLHSDEYASDVDREQLIELLQREFVDWGDRADACIVN
jgi:hypothetical protein